MKLYTRIVEGQAVLDSSQLKTAADIAHELLVEYTEDYVPPVEQFEEVITQDALPEGITKYDIISLGGIERVDGVLMRRLIVVPPDDQRILTVDLVLTHQQREMRNKMLAACDWTQLLDSSLSAEKKAEWATYRQTLRDITADPLFPTYHRYPSTPA